MFLGGLVFKLLACCTGGPGFDPWAEHPKLSKDLHQEIPAGCCSDETLNWRPLVPVSIRVVQKKSTSCHPLWYPLIFVLLPLVIYPRNFSLLA